MAVDLTKLSLWLATLAKNHPFTFLDHSVRCGDSLVGLTRRQISSFSWSNEAKPVQFVLGQADLDKMIGVAALERQKIIEATDVLLPHQKAEHLRKADVALDLVRLAGDCCISAFFEAENDRVRQTIREERAVEFSTAVRAAERGDSSSLDGIREQIRILREDLAQAPVWPFHWGIEFPEVFGNGREGFDAIVGNPPFAGKNTLIASNRSGYPDWLKATNEESHGNADLVAHFFRRAFTLLSCKACFGLIATKTIRQGDTRHTGLRWICVEGGGIIYAARRRYKWPGMVAVVVSVVWVTKGRLPGPFDLDGKSVNLITAYLFHNGGHENPALLAANSSKSFIGSYVLGMGFTFDDTDKKGVASSLAEMQRLVAKDPRNADRIFPYLGGEEVNDSPTHAHHRYVINFADFPLERRDLGKSWLRADTKQRDDWLRAGIVPPDYPDAVAADWPDLLEIVRRKVKPIRDKDNRESRRKFWWRFGETTPALVAALGGRNRALVLSRVRATGFCFLPERMVFSEQLVVFPFISFGAFSILQSRMHEVWAYFFSGSALDLIRYSPSDCFETFPFPDGLQTNAALEIAGREYHDFRATLMVRNNEGLTKTYNRFHNPEEVSADIETLRELHAAIDVAVLRAYGWEDLVPQCECEFLLDYEDQDEEDDDRKARKGKKPYHYRWPDEVRDEVLARLLKLNAERTEQERVLGTSKGRSKNPAKRSIRPTEQPTLI
jgi:hypothetical protein